MVRPRLLLVSEVGRLDALGWTTVVVTVLAEPPQPATAAATAPAASAPPTIGRTRVRRVIQWFLPKLVACTPYPVEQPPMRTREMLGESRVRQTGYAPGGALGQDAPPKL